MQRTIRSLFTAATFAVSCIAASSAFAVAPAPTDLKPLDGAVNVPTTMNLQWDASPGATSYNVYFGTSATPPQVSTNQTDTLYDATLAVATTYYYQVGSVEAGSETRSPVLSFTTLGTSDGSWQVVRGFARPDVESPDEPSNPQPDWEFNTNVGAPITETVVPVAGEAGNSAFAFLSGETTDGSGNYRMRYRQVTAQRDMPTTVVIRFRPLPSNPSNNLLYLEYYGQGWRQKLRVNQSNLEFQKAPGGSPRPRITFPSDYWDNDPYHTIRITYAPEGGNMRTTVYLDESTTPSGSELSSEAKTSDYFDVGRAGGSSYGAEIDFIAINPTEASAPGTGTPLPADLLAGAILPLQWAQPLEVKGDASSRMLTWSVTHQVNTSHFDVEASADGLAWATIGTLKADGDVVGEETFAYEDLRPTDGTVYYRVTQYDNDGQFESGNVAVYGGSASVAVYPNPTTGTLQVLGSVGVVQAEILDLTGRTVQRFDVNAPVVDADLSQLANGSYVIRLLSEDGTTQLHRVVKQ